VTKSLDEEETTMTMKMTDEEEEMTMATKTRPLQKVER
jgi:hypothetical protein